MPAKHVEGGSPVSTLEVNQHSAAQRRGAHRSAADVDPERPDAPYEEVRFVERKVNRGAVI